MDKSKAFALSVIELYEYYVLRRRICYFKADPSSGRVLELMRRKLHYLNLNEILPLSYISLKEAGETEYGSNRCMIENLSIMRNITSYTIRPRKIIRIITSILKQLKTIYKQFEHVDLLILHSLFFVLCSLFFVLRSFKKKERSLFKTAPFDIFSCFYYLTTRRSDNTWHHSWRRI